jgi:hypothetical protein
MIYSKKTVKGVFKVIRAVNPIAISMEQEQFLTAMQFWVKSRGRTGCDIFFTHDIALAEVQDGQYCRRKCHHQERVKRPDRFKFTMKWIVFSEALDTYSK